LGAFVVSIFPCDKGCNKEFIDPSTSQIHSLTVLLTYTFVPISLPLIGRGIKQSDKKLSSFATAVELSCILFVCLLLSGAPLNYIGLLQRIIEGSILLWIFICADHVIQNK
jgi:hypothetical protein